MVPLTKNEKRDEEPWKKVLEYIGKVRDFERIKRGICLPDPKLAESVSFAEDSVYVLFPTHHANIIYKTKNQVLVVWTDNVSDGKKEGYVRETEGDHAGEFDISTFDLDNENVYKKVCSGRALI